jgi:hypothetical protein
MLVIDHLVAYAQRIRDLRRAYAAVSEPALAPAFQDLLEGLLAEFSIGRGLTVVPEFTNPGVGRPDIALVRAGAPARAFVELKAPDKSANPARWRVAHDKRQFERLKELRCWGTSNFIDLFLFDRADEQGSARIVPERALDPAQSDAAAERLVRSVDPEPLLALVERLAAGAGRPPAARDAQHLAELLAHSSRLVRGIVQDRIAELRAGGIKADPLLDVHSEFQTVLYAHPEAGGYPARDFDILFSSAFAQTLAFGLLLVREGGSESVDATAYQHMPAEHPLMRTALRVLTQAEILDVVGIGFTVLLDTVNSFDPAILAVHPNHPDPILYFYEDFLSVFDPAARERHGVYFTPVEVVRFMVGALDRVARDDLGLTGLRDRSLTILDPATGTGTFLLGVAERVREGATAGGAGLAELELRDLAGRMFGLELLVGPYAVAHYRLHHTLRNPAGPIGAPSLPRLGVYLADTLAEPGAAAPAGRLGFVSAGIGDERRAADEVKSRQPILAIIGNPPYRRLEEGEDRTLVGQWLNGVWDDLKRPVRDAGQGNQLNTFPELSVAFWRWSMWKLFEAEGAPGKGVVVFITNRKFLTGWPYAGLRRMMRERFDRIEIIDLRGDGRRGPRAGVESDVNVFDIQVGVAITVAVADGSRAGHPAEVRYLDAWAEGAFSRSAKLHWLAGGSEAGRLPNAVPVPRNGLEDFRPHPFGNGEWPNLRECFKFSKSGMKSGNDSVFVNASRDELVRSVDDFLARLGRQPHDPVLVNLLSYRPFDLRWFYNDLRLLNRPGPELQRVWGRNNVGLYALPNGTGAGPAVWCHGFLPDYHAFRGSYGGYAFPLYDRRPESAGINLSPELLTGLAALYGVAIAPEEAFDAILCLLSARSYTLRFAEDLEDTFPHIPFPADHEAFVRTAQLGAQIRAIQTFAQAPTALADPAFVQLVTAPNSGATLDAGDPDGTCLTLCTEDESGQVVGLPAELWGFEVSGYPVLQRWLEGRKGQVVNLALFNAFRDVCGRLADLIDLYDRADTLLINTLDAPLTRDALWPPEEGSTE